MNLPEVYSLAVQVAIKDGAAPLAKTHPGKLWKKVVDEKWTLWLNGNDTELRTESGVTVQPYCLYGEMDGWPAISLSPAGGTVGHIGWCDFDVEADIIKRLKVMLE